MTDVPELIWIDKENIPHSEVYAGTYYLDDDEYHETIAYTLKDITDELADALGNLIELSDDHSPFGGEIYQDRVSRVWENAHAALAKYREIEK